MTNDQKQCLLRYLGYYTEDVDGIWGADSKAATKEFQKDNNLKEDGVFGSSTEKAALAHIAAKTGFKKVSSESTGGLWWKNIKHFTRDEFKCRCGGKYCKGFVVEPEEKLVRVADDIREELGAPATVTSGVRCTRHNANVGGVSNSRHLSGKAMDFGIKGKTADQIIAVVKKHPEIRYYYKIDNKHVHMDIA